MKFTDQLVLAGTLLGVADAALPVLNPRGTPVTIKQVLGTPDDHFNRATHAIRMVQRRHMKKGAPAGPGSKYKRANRGNGKSKSKIGESKNQKSLGGATAVANSINNDQQYICEIEVGGQKMRLNFDTGSSDLWVYSTLQPKHQQKDHKVYDLSKNSGKPMAGGTWNITYGDGSGANGKVHVDKVTVGPVSYDQQAFGIAQNVSDSFFTDNTNDGLLGLGFTTGNPGSGNTISVDGKDKPQNTFFTNIRHSLPLPLFTADLRWREPGSYDFGFIDKSKYTGDLVYFEANSSQAYWQIASTSYGVSGKETKQRSIQTIIDTGTTLMMMPQDVLDTYYKEVKGAKVDNDIGGYVYPCGTVLPDFEIGFEQGGQKFTAKIPAKYMDFGESSVGSSTCFGSMQVMSKGDTLDAIFGDIFLKAVFTVFEAVDDKSPRLGFAMKKSAVDLLGKPNDHATPAASSGTCAAISPASNPLGWFQQVFKNIQNAFTGNKNKDTCPATQTSGGANAGSDSSDDPNADKDLDSTNKDDADWEDDAQAEGKKKQDSKKKEVSALKKKKLAALEEEGVALLKKKKAAQAKLKAAISDDEDEDF